MWASLASLLAKVLLPLLVMLIHGSGKKKQGKQSAQLEQKAEEDKVREEARRIARRVRTDPDYAKRVRDSFIRR